MSSFIQALGGLSGAFWPTIIGAVVGAIVGGLISLCLQIYGVSVTKKERARAKRQNDLATAFVVMVKVVRIMSNLGNIKSIIETAIKKLKACSQGDELWQVMMPLVPVPSDVEFSSEEAAFILSTGQKTLILKALELSDIHNNFMHIILLYSEKREVLRQSLSIDAVRGDMTSTLLDVQTSNQLLPLRIELSQLAKVLAESIFPYYDKATQTFDALKAHCEASFADDFPKIERAEKTPE